MVRMMVRHSVRAYGKWRRAYNGFDREHRGLGVQAHAVYRNTAKPNEITVTHDFTSLSKARSFAKSRRLRELMKGAGVRGAPTIWFVKRA